MKQHKISSQSLNALFSLLGHIESVVFWISTADYSEQLYLSKGFENVWGRSCESIQTNLGIWATTLVPEDLAKNLPEFARRSTTLGSGKMNIRINHTDNALRYLRNTSFTLADSSGKPCLIAGIDEQLSAENWHQDLPVENKNPAILNDFITILRKEFKLITALPTNDTSSSSAESAVPKMIVLNGQSVKLSPREIDCLRYLLSGFSAKQTADKLKLSTRTIESYLDTLKRKAQCRTKLALLGKIQKSNLILPSVG